MFLVGLGFSCNTMDFFNDLLTSYSHLKKRSLRISLVEAQAPGTVSYTDLAKQTENPTAAQAVQETDRIISSVFPGVDPASTQSQQVNKVDIGADPLKILQQTGEKAPPIGGEGDKPSQPVGACGGAVTIVGSTIPVVKKDCTTNAREFGNYRNQVLNSVYSGALSQLGGGELTPEMQEVLGLTNSNALWDLGGQELTKSLADMFRESDALGISSLMKATGSETKRTIPTKIITSLLGGEGFDIASEEDVQKGIVTKYERPSSEYVTESVQNLAKSLSIINKFNNNRDNFTYEDAQFIKDNITLSTYKKHHGHFKVFIKANHLDQMGITFDWENRKKNGEVVNSPLQNVLETFQQDLKTWAQDKGLDEESITIPVADRSTFINNGTASLNKVITEVSETIDTLAVLLLRNDHKKAAKLFIQLLDNFGKGIHAALKLDEKVNFGELIGSETTEMLGASLELVHEHYGDVSQGNNEQLNSAFNAMVATVLAPRALDIKKKNPDMVVRVGGRAGAGGEGDKKDQLLLYKTLESAQVVNKKGRPILALPLNELLSPEELKSAKELYGLSKADESAVIYATSDSLKWTMDSSRTNLGSTASIRNVSQEFVDGGSEYIQTLMSKQGLSKSEQATVGNNFAEVGENIERLNSMFDTKTGSTTMTAKETARTFLQSLSPENKKDLGLNQAKLTSVLAEINTSKEEEGKKSTLVNALKKEIETKLILGQIQRGSSHEDEATAKSWRAVATSYLMRGCYDSSESDFVVQNYITGETFRYDGNKYLTGAMKSFIETGEGLNITKSGFSVNGYSTHFAMSKTGRHHMTMTGPVHGKPIRENSEPTAKELMSKLVEVQELIFSTLIKE